MWQGGSAQESGTDQAKDKGVALADMGKYIGQYNWRLQGDNNTCPIFKNSKILVLGQCPGSKLSTENIIWVKHTV